MLSPRSFFLTALLLLSACGFAPMHGRQSESARVIASGVRVIAPNDNNGQLMKQQLEDKLNPRGIVPANPAYQLTVGLTTATTAIGVARDGTVSRFNVNMTSAYQLRSLKDNRLIQSSNLQHVSSFNNQANQYYSTYISEKDAIERGIIELTNIYAMRVGALIAKDNAK